MIDKELFLFFALLCSALHNLRASDDIGGYRFNYGNRTFELPQVDENSALVTFDCQPYLINKVTKAWRRLTLDESEESLIPLSPKMIPEDIWSFMLSRCKEIDAAKRKGEAYPVYRHNLVHETRPTIAIRYDNEPRLLYVNESEFLVQHGGTYYMLDTHDLTKWSFIFNDNNSSGFIQGPRLPLPATLSIGNHDYETKDFTIELLLTLSHGLRLIRTDDQPHTRITADHAPTRQSAIIHYDNYSALFELAPGNICLHYQDKFFLLTPKEKKASLIHLASDGTLTFEDVPEFPHELCLNNHATTPVDWTERRHWQILQRAVSANSGSILALPPSEDLLLEYGGTSFDLGSQGFKTNTHVVIMFENQPFILAFSDMTQWQRIIRVKEEKDNTIHAITIMTPTDTPMHIQKALASNIEFIKQTALKNEPVTISDSLRAITFWYGEIARIFRTEGFIIVHQGLPYLLDLTSAETWSFINLNLALMPPSPLPATLTIEGTTYSVTELCNRDLLEKISCKTGLIYTDDQSRSTAFTIDGKTFTSRLGDNEYVIFLRYSDNTCNTYLLNTATNQSMLLFADNKELLRDQSVHLPRELIIGSKRVSLEDSGLRTMLENIERDQPGSIVAEHIPETLIIVISGSTWRVEPFETESSVMLWYQGQPYIYTFAFPDRWQWLILKSESILSTRNAIPIPDEAREQIERNIQNVKAASRMNKCFTLASDAQKVAYWYDNAPMLVDGPFIIMHQRQPYRITPGVEKWERILPNNSVVESDPFDIVILGEVYKPNTLTEETLTKLSRNGLITTDDQSPSAVFTVGDSEVVYTGMPDTTFILSYKGNTYRVRAADDDTYFSCFKINGEGKVTLKNEAPLPAQVVIHNGTNYESINLASLEADGIRESLRNAQNLAYNSGVIQAHKRDPLPTFKDCTAISLPDEICSICQEKLIDDSIETEDPIKTVCNHYFHLTCLRNALANSRHNTCPICRNEIV